MRHVWASYCVGMSIALGISTLVHTAFECLQEIIPRVINIFVGQNNPPNEKDMVSGLAYHPDLGNSDHYCLIFQFNCSTMLKEDFKFGFNYNKGDCNRL